MAACPHAPPAAANLPHHDDLELLKLNVISTDGGQYSSQYKCENLLQNDANVYCTKKKENVNICLAFAEEGPFTLTHLIVKAPEHG